MNKPIYIKEPYKCLCFRGEDSLRIAQFVSFLRQNHPTVLDRCIAYVEGRFTRNGGRDVMMLAMPVDADINVYVRRIMIRPIQNQILFDVGGANATLEAIAARRIYFLFFGFGHEWESSIVRDQDLTLYQIIPACPPTNAELLLFVKRGDYLRAIAAAKILANKKAADTLLSFLRSDLYKDKKAGDELTQLAGAFRSLYRLCRDKPDLSLRVTKELIEYIRHRTEAPDRAAHIICSIIYCIEALGYVAGEADSQAAKEACAYLTEIVGSEQICRIHAHIVWAAVVALEKIVNSNLDINQIHALRRRLESRELQRVIPSLEETLNSSPDELRQFGYNPRISEIIYKEAVKLTAVYCKKRKSGNLEMLFNSLGLNNSDLEEIKPTMHQEEPSNRCWAKKEDLETVAESKINSKIMEATRILSWEMAKEVAKEIVRNLM